MCLSKRLMGRIGHFLEPISSLAYMLGEIGSINGYWTLRSIDYCEPHFVFLVNSPFYNSVIIQKCCFISEINSISSSL